uniref:Uncharacterized protein n=1 Tax=Oryza barthii TaxID=65489 RepID=A0A0D3GJ52_9ORYZ
MMARTAESAALTTLAVAVVPSGDGDATARRRRRTSSSRTARKDCTRRALRSSRVQIFRSCLHPSP